MLSLISEAGYFSPVLTAVILSLSAPSSLSPLRLPHFSLPLATFLSLSLFSHLSQCHSFSLVGLLTFAVRVFPYKRSQGLGPQESRMCPRRCILKSRRRALVGPSLGPGPSPSPREAWCGRHLVAMGRCGAGGLIGTGGGCEPFSGSGAVGQEGMFFSLCKPRALHSRWWQALGDEKD